MDEQKQKVGENGVAFQAGGDINIGMNYIFFTCFKTNIWHFK